MVPNKSTGAKEHQRTGSERLELVAHPAGVDRIQLRGQVVDEVAARHRSLLAPEHMALCQLQGTDHELLLAAGQRIRGAMASHG